MSDAKVQFTDDDWESDTPGKEECFTFACPNKKGNYPNGRCGALFIAGRTAEKRDGQNKNGGVAQWDWDGNRDAPTFTPSINCPGCWHGYIRQGRCVNAAGTDEPEHS